MHRPFLTKNPIGIAGIKPMMRIGIMIKKEAASRLDTASKINLGNVLLSHNHASSTIAAGGLNFRVRDGNGCTPSAKVAKKLVKLRTLNMGFRIIAQI